MEFYKICPIVFNTIEKLKAEVGFDSPNNWHKKQFIPELLFELNVQLADKN